MAARSPETAPPPAPRPTVVLRAGPPPRSGLADLAVGAVGLLLLLLSVGLAVALPKQDVLPQQFRVAYLDETHDLTQQAFQFGPGATVHDFVYDVPDDDVYLISVSYSFIDDVAASAPDQFLLRLYDPHGAQVGPELVAIGSPATPTSVLPPPADEAAFAEYTPVLHEGRFTVLQPKPADGILEVADQETTADEVAHDLAAQAHLDTRGAWRLRVSLLQAGGCEPPSSSSPSPEAANRYAVCRQELADRAQQGTADPQDAAQGRDAGNLFTVGVFSYSRFVPDVEKVG